MQWHFSWELSNVFDRGQVQTCFAPSLIEALRSNDFPNSVGDDHLNQWEGNKISVKIKFCMYWILVAYISVVLYLNWLFSILIHWGSSSQWEISASLSSSITWPPEERCLIRLAQTALRVQAHSSARDVADSTICFTPEWKTSVWGMKTWNNFSCLLHFSGSIWSQEYLTDDCFALV